jgi:GxxExxY protein
MNMNMEKLSPDDPVYRIIGCAMEVLNSIGHGLREKTYERALMVEFRHQGLEYETQRVFPVYYRNEQVDEYIPDLIVDGDVVVDTKTVDAVNNDHIGQMLNYLRITGLNVGLLINFKHARLPWRKVVLNENED